MKDQHRKQRLRLVADPVNSLTEVRDYLTDNKVQPEPLHRVRWVAAAVAVVVEAEVEAEVEVVVPGHKVPVPINGPDIKITDHQGHGWVDTIPDGWDTVDRRRLLLLHRERKDRRVLLVPHHSHLKWGVTRGCRDRPNGVSGKVKDHLLHPEWLHLLFLVLIRWVQSHHHREVLHRCQVSHHLATIHGVSSSNSNRRTITEFRRHLLDSSNRHPHCRVVICPC